MASDDGRTARPRLVLASASPRRADLLREAGFAFTVQAADIDESVWPDERPEHYVERLALDKARAVAARNPGALVLGADTTVVADGLILGKPVDAADAARMVARLCGRSHLVHTGVALARDREIRSAVATTTVWFEPMTPDDIAAYVATGEPMDKAGAYGIQGAASRYVSRIEGALDTVIGLPLATVDALIRDFPDATSDDRPVTPAPTSAGALNAPHSPPRRDPASGTLPATPIG